MAQPRATFPPLATVTSMLVAAVLAGGLVSLAAVSGHGAAAQAVRPPKRAVSASSPATRLPLATPRAPGVTGPVYRPPAPVLSAPSPTRLEIPALGVRTDLVSLGLAGDGTLEVPRDYSRAGWYTGGPKPGETGPALIAGHVDSYTGPAVFYRLKDLVPGNDLLVIRDDGSVVRFVVDRVARFPKAAFPTAEVFGPTTGPTLRLVTCGGEFDRSRRSYRDNIVTFASPARP